MICKGYAEANNKFLKSDDANKPPSCNTYLGTKLGNNGIFDKSIENPVKKVDVKIVTSRKQYLR